MPHTNLTDLFEDIADAIREKTGENGLIKADEFPEAIEAITGGGEEVDFYALRTPPTEANDGDVWIDCSDTFSEVDFYVSEEEPEVETEDGDVWFDYSDIETDVESLSVTANGTYTAEAGAAYSPVIVNVQPDLEDKNVTITENGSQTVTPSGDKDGLSSVAIAVNVPNPSSGSLSITENGTYDVTEKASAVVNVPNPSSGSISITENGTYDVTEKASAVVEVSGGGGATEPYREDTVNAHGSIIGSVLHGYTVVPPSCFAGQSNMTNIILPNSSTSIGNYAFDGCNVLALASLPSGITSIGNYAFRSCYRLTLTSLPSGITSIGEYAFYGCVNLALTSLPSGITSIGNYAFRGCTSLTSLTFEGKPNTVGMFAFNTCTNLLDIYVPWAEGAVSNAPWGATNATIHYNYTG